MPNRKNPNEESNINKAKQWGKDVDNTDKKIDKVNKETKDPNERLRRLLNDED